MYQNERYIKSLRRRERIRIFLQILIIVLALLLFARYLVLPNLFPDRFQKAAETTTTTETTEPTKDSDVFAVTGNTSYTPYQESVSSAQRGKGFIALSYFGVAEEGTQTVISKERLTEHLQALKDAGYVTITAQDVYDYYYKGKSLPENSLFLFFEDGRRRSAEIAQDLLEQFGYCASMLSYGNNLNTDENYFLSADDLKEMEANGYWSLGTNGYRLSYINVFDRHENYLGELTPTEYYYISPYVKREYNHYLMDFIRDKFDIPVESKESMQERIALDYSLMYDVYNEELGKLPMLYCLMHSNTGQFATNDVVSEENEKLIRQYFALNFNREMYCLNDLDTNMYDLTRMQPQAYWYTNHLLMRVIDDTGNTSIQFVQGDMDRYYRWNVLQGAVEFKDDLVVVTSLPEGVGLVTMPSTYGLGNFTLSTRFVGNKLGTQSVDLCADLYQNAYVAVEIQNNTLRIYRGSGTYESVDSEDTAAADDEDDTDAADENVQDMLYEIDLDEFDGVVYQTWEENRQEALAVEIPLKYAQTYQAEASKEIAADLERAQADTSNANYEDYIPDISIQDAGDRLVEITYYNGALSVSIDGKPAVENLMINIDLKGGIALRSAWSEYGYSQRNLADDVYDGVFKSLYITSSTTRSSEDARTIIDYRSTEPEVQEDTTEEEVSTTEEVTGEEEETSIDYSPLIQITRTWENISSRWNTIWNWVSNLFASKKSD